MSRTYLENKEKTQMPNIINYTNFFSYKENALVSRNLMAGFEDG